MKTEFEQELQNHLRHSEQGIADAHLDSLSSIRQQALNARPGSSILKPTHLRRFFWPTTVGMVLSSILVLILATPLSPFRSSQPTASNAYLSDNIELYEDLDFYYWLAVSEQDLRG